MCTSPSLLSITITALARHRQESQSPCRPARRPGRSPGTTAGPGEALGSTSSRASQLLEGLGQILAGLLDHLVGEEVEVPSIEFLFHGEAEILHRLAGPGQLHVVCHAKPSRLYIRALLMYGPDGLTSNRLGHHKPVR